MNKIKKILIASLLLVFAGMANTSVEAAGQNNGISVTYSINASKTTVNVGGTVDVSIRVSGASKKVASNDITLTYDATKFKYENYSTPSNVQVADVGINANTSGKVKYSYYDYQGGSNAISSETVVTFTFKALELTTDATGDFSFKVVGVADEDANFYNVTTTSGSKSVNIHVPSTNNYLSSLTLSSGTLSPLFNKDTTKYSATVDASSVTISATRDSNYASIEGTGTFQLKYGDNNFTIKVKSESGAIRAYVIVINRPDNRSSENSLSELSVSNTDMKFDGSQIYNLTVENDVTSVNISGKAKDSKSTVTGLGNHNLKVGTNNIVIKVTAENEKVKQYTITITRKNKENINSEGEKSSNNNLKSLSIEGAIIEFDKNTLEYSVTVPFSQNKLKVNYVTEDKKSTVNIVGGNNLIVGNNSIAIIVTAENGAIKTYNLTVIRNDDKLIVDNSVESIKEALDGFDNFTINLNKNEKAVIFDSEILKLLNDNNKVIIFDWYDNNDLISSLTIDGSNISVASRLNPNVTNVINNQALLERVRETSYIGINTLNTNIPSDSLYRMKVTNNNSNYNLSYILNGQVVNKALTPKEGYIEFNISNNMEYAIWEPVLINNTTESKFEWLFPTLVTVMLALVFAIAGVIVYRKFKTV